MTTKIKNKFLKTINKIFPKPSDLPKKIAIGVSGGIDSLSLTFLLDEFCKKQNIELFAITVDHNIRYNSKQEAKFVNKLLTKNNIKHIILDSYLTQAPKSNIEGILREVRYNLLAEFCLENQINHLFIGHHNNDLAENFLIRLFRGSGIDGLAAMDYVIDYQQIKLIRPLLDFSKTELKEYLIKKNINWVEDESNDDEKFLRNKIRKFLKQLPESELINQRIALAAKSILQSKQIIENDMVKNKDEILQFFDLGYFLLSLKSFKNLHSQKAKRYLAWALMEVSGNYYKPRMEKLDNLYNWILEDKNYKARSFYGCVIEGYNNEKLIIYRERKAINNDLKIKANNQKSVLFDNRFLIELPKATKKQNSENIEFATLNAVEFNQLIKNNENLQFLREVKNPLKKVFYTIPILKKQNKIIAIPNIDYGLKTAIKFNFKTPLGKNNQ